MGAISGIARWLIGVFNGIFGVCTVGMIAGGIVIKFTSSILKDFGSTQLDEIKKSVEAMFPGQIWSTDNWDLNDILGNVAIFLIVAGAVLLIICIIGCSASCLKVKKLLLVVRTLVAMATLLLWLYLANSQYTVVIVVLFLTQIIMLIVVYASPSVVKDPVKSSLKESLKNFQGLNGTNTNSVTWNFMMRYYACCGVSNYQDFKDYSTWWGITEHVTPYACCIDLPTTSTKADSCAGISSGLPTTFLIDSNFDYGCVDAAGDFFFVKNKTYVIVAIVVVFLAQAVLIACSIVLIKEKDGKVRPMSHDEYSRSRPPKLPERPLRSTSNMYTDVPDMNYRTKF